MSQFPGNSPGGTLAGLAILAGVAAVALKISAVLFWLLVAAGAICFIAASAKK